MSKDGEIVFHGERGEENSGKKKQGQQTKVACCEVNRIGLNSSSEPKFTEFDENEKKGKKGRMKMSINDSSPKLKTTEKCWL